MKVLFYKDNEISPNMGGISRISSNLRDSLVRRGYECVYVSSRRNEHITPAPCQQWLPVLGKDVCDENVKWLHDYIVKNDVNVIINNCFVASAARFLDAARKGTNCKLITWFHNNVVEYGSLIGYRKEKLFRDKHLTLVYRLMTCRPTVKILRHLSKRKHQATAKACYECSDRVVTVCDGNIREFLFLLGQKDVENKVLAIPNFVTSLTKEVPSDEKENSVVWCGSVDYELKKTNWMLDIWRMVQDRHPEWSLTIMGDSAQLESIKTYAKKIGTERVVFTGRVNPEPYYRKASIICSTSITESFGLTMVEGMQRRVVPVAFSSSSAFRDVVGYNGRLVKPFNKKLFAEELSDMMLNGVTRKFLAEKCRVAAWQYDEAYIISLWEKLIQLI